MACNDEICQLRILIGDFEEPFELPDGVLGYHLDSYEVQTNIPLKLWCAALDAYQSLMLKYAKDGSRMREREGSVEREEYRNEKYKAVQQGYKQLLKKPPKGVARAGIILGGVSKEEIARVNDDTDSNTYGIEVDWFKNQNSSTTLDQGYTAVT